MKSLSSTFARCASGSLIALGLVAAGGAQAATTFQFSASESASFAPGDAANTITGAAFGTADDVGDAIPGSWFTSLTFDAALDTGLASGSWSFIDAASGNSLSGTFTALINSATTGLINYTVTDGDGMFAGATGTGTSTATLTDLASPFADFTEAGSFSITAAVPEPSTTALMFAGLGVVGYAARRRRKA